jgi:hypothetical protein
MRERGYLEGKDMAMSFNMLRANDLIWSFVVDNYLLGKEPLRFDLLYWNSDSTRMPVEMHSFYLRAMYHENLLAKPGGITLDGVPIDLTRITTPTFMISTREDHMRRGDRPMQLRGSTAVRSNSCSRNRGTSLGSSAHRAADTVITRIRTFLSVRMNGSRGPISSQAPGGRCGKNGCHNFPEVWSPPANPAQEDCIPSKRRPDPTFW